MKIKCPNCGQPLYTNPFHFQEKLHCPSCGEKAVPDQQGALVLSRMMKLDFMLSIVSLAVIHFMTHNIQLDLFVLLMILAEWMFEIPLRYLVRRGIFVWQREKQTKTNE